MTNLHKRRKIIKEALLDGDDNRSEISVTSKRSRASAAVDQQSVASHHTHVSRQSKLSGVRQQHAPPPTNVPSRSKRDSIATHISRHSQLPQQERRSPALSHVSHHSHIQQQQQRPASPVPSHISQQQRQQSLPPFIPPEHTSSQDLSRMNNVSLRRDRSLFERNNREGTPSEFGLNDKQYADLSKIIHEAFNTTIHQIEEEDSNSKREEAYKRVVANAKRKAMSVLKRLQVPPKMADTVFDINLHKEKADKLREELKLEVDDYIEVQLALAAAEYKHEKDKEKLKETHAKLSEEQAIFNAEHDQLGERHPLVNAPPPKDDYAFNLLKYPASSFNPKRDV